MRNMVKSKKCLEKVAIVTGGGRGIGKAFVLALAEQGAWVSVWGRSLEPCNQVVEEIRQAGGRAMAVQVDVSDSSQVKGAVDTVLTEFGKIDILINNAGIARAVPIEEISGDDWDRVMAVNARGTFLCCKAVMNHMKQRGYGKIINIGSGAGKYGSNAAGAHYAASKAAVICFTRCLARELAPYGINVNSISPGPVMTDLLETLSGGDMNGFLATVPLGRIGSPEEVAPVAVLLASDDSSYMTGENIDVNGGVLMD